MTSLYRVELYILDLNQQVDLESVKYHLENHRYLDFVTIADLRETDIGKWSDDHPLNFSDNHHLYPTYFPEILATDKDDPWFKQEHQRIRRIMLQGIKRNQELEREVERLKKENAQLSKVKDFVTTIKDLTH